MASFSSTYPSQRPVFSLDAANAGRLDPRCSFTRASTGTYFGTEKVLSSENILLQSQTLDTTWAAVDVATPAGSQTAPDGSSTAWLLTADSASSQAPYVRLSPTFSGSTQYTMVGHLKAGTASHGYISFRTQNGYSAYALLDFSGGTVSHAGFGDFTGVSSSVTALGSSWFKVTLTATTGSNLSGSNVLVGISDGTTPTSAGYATWTSAGETMYAWGIQLATTNAKVYDSPTTTQIARSYQTKLQTAASGVARFEHSATDGQSGAKGILIEGQFQQDLTYTEDLTNAHWTKSNTTIQSNAGVAPDGTLTADLIVESDDSGTTIHRCHNYNRGTPASGVQYTFSAFVKAAGRNHIELAFAQYLGISGDIVFNLTDGSTSGQTGNVSASSATNCGNGWWRVSVTTIPTTNANALTSYFNMHNGSTYAYEGNGYGAVLVWGANQTQSSHAYSYLKAEGSATTKAAESLSMTDSSLFDNGGGALFVEASSIDKAAAYSGIASLNDGSSTNRVEVYNYYTYVRGDVSADGATQSSQYGGAFSPDVSYKACLTYASNNVSLYANGSEVGAADTAACMPTVDRITLGNTNSGTNYLNGHIKRVAVYSEALTDTNLQALTS